MLARRRIPAPGRAMSTYPLRSARIRVPR
jgi:hypothetical protein